MNAETSTVVPIGSPTSCTRWVGRVQAVTGTLSCCVREQARASMKTIGTNRLRSMTTPSAVFSQTVFTVSPAKAGPLLLAAEVKA